MEVHEAASMGAAAARAVVELAAARVVARVVEELAVAGVVVSLVVERVVGGEAAEVVVKEEVVMAGMVARWAMGAATVVALAAR